MADLLAAAGGPAQHAIVVDCEDPQTALLAGPWPVYTSVVGLGTARPWLPAFISRLHLAEAVYRASSSLNRAVSCEVEKANGKENVDERRH